MKMRRHHNNKGTRKIRRGKTYDEVRRMAKRLGIKYGRTQAQSSAQQTPEVK